jgi:ABC-type uncharacterized transport system permease subunit
MIIPLPLFCSVVAILYFAGAIARWQSAKRAPGAPHVGKWHVAAAYGTLFLNIVLCAVAILRPDGIDFSVGNAITLAAALCVAIAWGSGLMRFLPGFSIAVLFGGGICALMPLVLAEPQMFPYSTHWMIAVHVFIAFAAYAIFCVAALLALVMASLSKRIRRGTPAPAPHGAVPLLTLERYLFRLLIAGFVLLTITVVASCFFSQQIFNEPFHWTHKACLSIISWVIFGMLLFGRWRFGWRGRRAYYWVLTGTVALMLAYFGYKIIIELIA